DSNITRADYLLLLIRTFGLTADVSSNFDDVEPGTHYYDAVGIAKELGVTNGIGNNKFAPRENISRQDMMVLTARALEKFKELNLTSDITILNKFSDKNEIAGYAEESLATLVKESLIIGSNNMLFPKDNTTRAEAAVFLYRIFNQFPN
ncbi:MAG TPA: cellulosome anchor protein, partial [Clostridiales bacterium]|nr:cellulosome anchor protein [Clostridiales bacterium]